MRETIWSFIERLSADDLRAMAVVLGASDEEVRAVLSRDRLITLVCDHATQAAGDPNLGRADFEPYVLSQFDQAWPHANGGGLEERLGAPILDGIATVLRIGVLVASANGVLSRPERRFLTETVQLLGLPPHDTERLLKNVPRKAAAADLSPLESSLRSLSADQEAMRACLSFAAAVAVVDEVLRRPEIELYYALSERLGEEHKEAALLLEEVRRSYGAGLQSIDPVAAGALSVPTAAALSAAFTTGFLPFLTTRPGLKWIGSVMSETASHHDLRDHSSAPNEWRTWAGMVVALGAAFALCHYRGPVRLDRLLPLFMYRTLVPEPRLPSPALPEFTTPPW